MNQINRMAKLRGLALLVGAMLLTGCVHVPANIKTASARQAEDMAAFEKNLKEQDLGTKCFESAKASIDMESNLEKRGKEIQEQINKQFADSMSRAQAFREKNASEIAAKKEAEAVRVMIEQTMNLQTQLAAMRADIEEERSKCKNAIAVLQDILHSFATSQTELDKFIQADAKTPLETFFFSLSSVKPLEREMQSVTDKLQDKMKSATDKMQQLESVIKKEE